MGCVVTIVIVVLSLVATISKPLNAAGSLVIVDTSGSKVCPHIVKCFPSAFLPFNANKSLLFLLNLSK